MSEDGIKGEMVRESSTEQDKEIQARSRGE